MGNLFYEDSSTGELYTFESLKESNEKKFKKDISDKEMDDYIFQNLVQNGGNLIVHKSQSNPFPAERTGISKKAEKFSQNIWGGNIGQAEMTILGRLYDSVYGPEEDK